MRESVELFIRGVHLIAAIIWFGGVVFFYLRRDANSATQLATAKPVSGPQSFSDVGKTDDPCFTNNRRDGIFYCCME